MAAQTPVITISSSPNGSQAQPGLSTHRLATQSAADALGAIGNVTRAAISSGLKHLDNSLTGNNPAAGKGFERGKICEIWGPAGAGKTAIAFQAALECVKADGNVAWLDCTKLLAANRLDAFEIIGLPEGLVTETVMTERFRYLSVSTLSHLLPLVLHPPTSFPPPGTELLVIDDLDGLVNIDYPRFAFANGNKSEQQKWQANRRYAILGTLVTALVRLASLRDIAIIVTSGCASRMRSHDGLPAAINPGVGGAEWEAGIWSRIIVFRDFAGRFAGVQKCQGKNLMPLDPTSDVRNAIGFEIAECGTVKERHITVDLLSSSPAVPTETKRVGPAKPARKRFYEEIADSDEDEDEFGWAEADDTVTATQGLDGVQGEPPTGDTT